MHQYQKIGIIAAMQMEAEALKAKILQPKETVLSGLTFTEGLLCGVPVVLSVCGEGKVNAAICAQTMILRFAPDLLLNTGVAGNLSDVARSSRSSRTVTLKSRCAAMAATSLAT